ncbi:MAG TPA: CDGSH iron-sulfur domain-containing protein [Bacteroides sp.]|nr:CDGSH iron-sulfur domain-containing protein [Bacteroides sp.]
MSERKATFRVNRGGPLEVTGKFRILDARGEEIEKEGPVYLCRCGGSRNKPFCDDTHKTRDFKG